MAGGVGTRATWPGLREGGAEVEGAVRVEDKAAGGVEAEAGGGRSLERETNKRLGEARSRCWILQRAQHYLVMNAGKGD